MDTFDHAQYGVRQYNIHCRICNDIIPETRNGFCETCVKLKKPKVENIDGFLFTYCGNHRKYMPMVLKCPVDLLAIHSKCNCCLGRRPYVPSLTILAEAHLLPVPAPQYYVNKPIHELTPAADPDPEEEGEDLAAPNADPEEGAVDPEEGAADHEEGAAGPDPEEDALAAPNADHEEGAADHEEDEEVLRAAETLVAIKNSNKEATK